MSSTRVFLSLLRHHLMYPFCLLCHYSVIRMKMNCYITPLLRLRLRDISIRFPRQSNGRNSGGVWVFLMELFTRSWSSLYDFLSTFPSSFFEWLTSLFNKVLKFVTSPPRVEYLFYLLYVGLGSRVDNSIIWFLRLLLKCGYYIRREIWFIDNRMNQLPYGGDFEFVSWLANFSYYRERSQSLGRQFPWRLVCTIVCHIYPY